MSEVVAERRGAAIWLVVNREERRNALNEAVLAALREAVLSVGRYPEVRAVVLTGAGTRAFCAGGDLKPDAEGDPFRIDPSETSHPVVRLFEAIVECPVPVIARVNGHALAGGFGLVCVADFAIAVDTAKFGVPEARIGLFPMMILPHMLRTIPRRKLLELCVTGEPVNAADALAHGILNYVVTADALDTKVEELVTAIAKSSPSAIRMGRRALAMLDAMPLRNGLEYAQRVLPQMARTEDAREGFRAFNEKRPPVWTGR